MTDPMELVGRLEGHEARYRRSATIASNRVGRDPSQRSHVTLNNRRADDMAEAAACIREMVEQMAGLYDAVSLGFYDGFRDAITRDPWEDCHDYAASKGADYAKAAMAGILAKQAADPSRRLNPLPPAPGAEA